MFFYAGLWLGKLAGMSSKAIGKQGSSIPGKVALKFDKSVLKKLAMQVENIIVVTGTNGKTTTANLLSQALEAHHPGVLSNPAGSNMAPGVVSSFITKASLAGTISECSYAILEVDEGTMEHVLPHIQPKAIVITNFFRDQLDRHGQIENIIERVRKAIAPLDTHLLLNADDPFSVRFSTLGKPTSYYGLKANAYAFAEQRMSDSKYCVCGQKFAYESIHYGQLGHYFCGKCGFKRPDCRYEVTQIEETKGLAIVTDELRIKTHLRGAYNAYNVLAAFAAASFLHVPNETIQQGFFNYTPNNGRMQRFFCKGDSYYLNLAKNPQGVNSTLSDYLKEKDTKQVLLVLNDLGADGKDPSWIWDADYEHLFRVDVKQVICSGTRAEDMAIRVHYAGVPRDRISTIPDIKEAVDFCVMREYPTYIISNYTPLTTVQKTLINHPMIAMDEQEVPE